MNMEQNEDSSSTVRFRSKPLIHSYEVQESAGDLALRIAGVTRREAINWLQQALYDVDHKHARSVMPARGAAAEQCDAERWCRLRAWDWVDEPDQLCAAMVATALAQELEIKKGVEIEFTAVQIELLARDCLLEQGEGSAEESATMGQLSPTHCSGGGSLHEWPEEDSGISYPCSTCHNLVRHWCAVSECCGFCCGVEGAIVGTAPVKERGYGVTVAPGPEAAVDVPVCVDGTCSEDSDNHDVVEGGLTIFDDY